MVGLVDFGLIRFEAVMTARAVAVPTRAETSSATMAFAATMGREGESAAARAVVSEALVDAFARGAALDAREFERVLEGVRRGMACVGRRGRACVGAFDVFGALSGAVGKSEALDAVGAAVAERAAKKTEGDDDAHAARAMEALRFYVVRRGVVREDGVIAPDADSNVGEILAPMVNFATKLLDAETSSEDAAQAALFLAAVCAVCGHLKGVDDGWRAKARAIMNASPISIRTLVGAKVKYMSRARAKDAARRALKKISHVTTPIADATLSKDAARAQTIDTSSSSLPPVQTPRAVVEDDEREDAATRDAEAEAAAEKKQTDASFAMRRHFECVFTGDASGEISVHDFFSYKIDVVCAFSQDFLGTVSSAIKWVRKCRMTQRRAMLLKVNDTSHRTMEHALRTKIEANISALGRLAHLADMVGVRRLILANKDKPFVTSRNVDEWVQSGFDLVRVIARSTPSLGAFCVVAFASHTPSNSRVIDSLSVLSARMAFIRWSRAMYSRRAEAKEKLVALVHYETAVMRKAFGALREYAPYHRERSNELVLKFGRRWRNNARSRSQYVSFDQEYASSSTNLAASGSDSIARANSFYGSKPWSPSINGPGSSARAKSRRTLSVLSRGSKGPLADHWDLEPDAPVVALTDEQRRMQEVFHAWIEFVYEQISTGSNMRAIEHRNVSLMRKSFKAMRRYVVRSVGVREKAVAVENAAHKLDFFITGGTAFRRWLKGVRYIKRLYAFVDEEVVRWRTELRMNCFRAWREVAASGAQTTLWEEQMLADVTPTLNEYRRRVWMRHWIDATNASLEERYDAARKHRTSTLLRAWKTCAERLAIRRCVDEMMSRLSLESAE